jgi:hypothetical protein
MQKTKMLFLIFPSPQQALDAPNRRISRCGLGESIARKPLPFKVLGSLFGRCLAGQFRLMDDTAVITGCVSAQGPSYWLLDADSTVAISTMALATFIRIRSYASMLSCGSTRGR